MFAIPKLPMRYVLVIVWVLSIAAAVVTLCQYAASMNGLLLMAGCWFFVIQGMCLEMSRKTPHPSEVVFWIIALVPPALFTGIGGQFNLDPAVVFCLKATVAVFPILGVMAARRPAFAWSKQEPFRKAW